MQKSTNTRGNFEEEGQVWTSYITDNKSYIAIVTETAQYYWHKNKQNNGAK